MKIQLRKEDYEIILSHAKAGLPNEACGLIGGRIEEGVKIIQKVYLLTNIDKSREHFSIDPKEQLAAIRDMRSLDMVPLGNFHSHPDTPSRPSEEDIRLAYDNSASYLILSLADNEPVLKSFHVENGAVEQEDLEILF
jgi:proteasome lid subunit RPN8/RPN11